eukprot:13070463-Alexandrium_andersonii.AAC.1
MAVLARSLLRSAPHALSTHEMPPRGRCWRAQPLGLLTHLDQAACVSRSRQTETRGRVMSLSS